MKPKQEDPKEMVGGCCVCSDENGWAENPLVYCDGQGCNVAVHQACYGIVTVPTGAWFCRKCESQERAARVRCELCPSKDGALKRTDSGGWAHVVCALYIPEVRFGNVTTMEPIMLQLIPQERFNKSCYLCDEAQRGSKATIGACMQCNRTGCKNHFHVTCAQAMGLLCEEAGNYLDNVKYCGYCQYHYNKLLPNFQRRGSHVKTIPPYRPVPHDAVSSDEDKAPGNSLESKDLKLKKRSSKTSPIHDSNKQLTREVKVSLSELSGPSKTNSNINLNSGENSQEHSVVSDYSVSLIQNTTSGSGVVIKSDSKSSDKPQLNSCVPNVATCSGVASVRQCSNTSSSSGISDTKTNSVTSITFPSSSLSLTSVTLPISSGASVIASETVVASGLLSVTAPQSIVTTPSPTCTTSATTSETLAPVVSSVSTIVSLSSKIKTSSGTPSSSHSLPLLSVSLSSTSMEKDKQRKMRRSGPRSSGSLPPTESENTSLLNDSEKDNKEGTLTICEERNLSVDRDKSQSKVQSSPEDSKLNVQFTPNVSAQTLKGDSFHSSNSEASLTEPMKRSRSNSQDRGRRSKRGSSSSGSGPAPKRGRMTLPARESAKESRDSEVSSPESMTTDSVPKRGRNSKAEIKDAKESLNSVITNGLGANTLLLGNQINPASAVAQKMTDTLHAELEAHSIYKEEEKVNIGLVGPTLPGKRETSTPGAVLNSAQPPPLPQSLEQLLERQWEQGSQFLMEQAQHFDIASLLSCLHQLRQENVRLEETVNSLVARRDHLLAVNARLSVPLASNQTTSTSTTPTQASSSTTPSSSTSGSSSSSSSGPSIHPPPSSSSSSLVSITPAGSSSISASVGGAHLSQISYSGVSASPVLSSSRSHVQQRHPSGGNSHPSMSNPGSNISGRGASPHDRRAPHQGPPIENGLGEPEYRYRSPGSDHQHRQQSPMLPPGAQPSPTSMRQSPASSSYHSSSSPHTGVSSLSPSGVSHPPPPHTLVAHVPTHASHGHPATMASSSHGPSHSVALSRSSEPHSRAELVRLTSSQPHSNPTVGYPVYQMVSPPVPGPHHSPVGISQHPPHSQVLRREVVDSGRSSHSLEKR